MARTVNLTPHPITIRVGGKEITLPPSGRVARVGTRESPAGSISHEGVDIPLVAREWEDVQLPAPEEVGCGDDPTSCVMVVSSLVGEAIRAHGLPPEWRGATVVVPDTGPTAVRDGAGRIVAVTRLVLIVRGR